MLVASGKIIDVFWESPKDEVGCACGLANRYQVSSSSNSAIEQGGGD